MRLRHKKNAENDILTHPFVIQTRDFESTDVKSNLSMQSPQAPLVKFCNPEIIFNNNKPVHLELGMGKGKFVTEMSKLYPNINFIGIEKSATIVLKAIDNLNIMMDATTVGANATTVGANACGALSDNSSSDLLTTYPNLRFMCEDIENLSNIFKPHSIDKIYLNFSDPWPKKRHESRRLTHDKFLNIYEKLLKPNQILEFKTDNLDLFNYSLLTIKNSNFDLLEFTYDLHNDIKLNEGNIMTEYEAKFSKLGNKICKLIAKSN